MRKILSFVLIFMMSAIFALSYADDYDFVYNKHETFEDAVQVDVIGEELEVVYEAVYEEVYDRMEDEYGEGNFEIILDKAQIHAWLEGEGVEPMSFEEFIEAKMHDNGNKYGIMKEKKNPKALKAKSNGKGRGLGRNVEGKAKGFRAFYDNIDWEAKYDQMDGIVNKNGNPMPGKFQYKYDSEDVLNSNLMLVVEDFKLITDEDGETFEEFIDTGEEINIAIHLEFMVEITSGETEYREVSGWVGDEPFNDKRDWVVYFEYEKPE